MSVTLPGLRDHFSIHRRGMRVGPWLFISAASSEFGDERSLFLLKRDFRDVRWRSRELPEWWPWPRPRPKSCDGSGRNRLGRVLPFEWKRLKCNRGRGCVTCWLFLPRVEGETDQDYADRLRRQMEVKDGHG